MITVQDVIEKLEDILACAKAQGKDLSESQKYVAISGALEGLLKAYISELEKK